MDMPEKIWALDVPIYLPNGTLDVIGTFYRHKAPGSENYTRTDIVEAKDARIERLERALKEITDLKNWAMDARRIATEALKENP